MKISLLASLPVTLLFSAGIDAQSPTPATNSAGRVRPPVRENRPAMSPEERQAIRDLRRGTNAPPRRETNAPVRRNIVPNLTPEQREARIAESRAKLEGVVDTLRKKRDDGSITEEEKLRLTRMENILKRVDETRGLPGDLAPPTGGPSGTNSEKTAVPSK